jgi:TPR repeat protein
VNERQANGNYLKRHQVKNHCMSLRCETMTMRNILFAIILLSGCSNALACYDKAPGGAKILDDCLKLADRGDVQAQYKLGNMYASGFGVAIDVQAAEAWYLKSANLGYAEAQYALGALYEDLPGTAPSNAPSFNTTPELGGLSALAAGANPGTTFDLCIQIGDGPIEAIKWYRLSAAQGHTSAQLKLGNIYQLGRGVPQDDMLAYMWFDIAAKQGREEAFEYRKTVAARIDPELISEAQAWADDWLLEFR